MFVWSVRPSLSLIPQRMALRRANRLSPAGRDAQLEANVRRCRAAALRLAGQHAPCCSRRAVSPDFAAPSLEGQAEGSCLSDFR